MKKILYFFGAIFALAFTSCSKDEVCPAFSNNASSNINQSARFGSPKNGDAIITPYNQSQIQITSAGDIVVGANVQGAPIGSIPSFMEQHKPRSNSNNGWSSWIIVLGNYTITGQNNDNISFSPSALIDLPTGEVDVRYACINILPDGTIQYGPVENVKNY